MFELIVGLGNPGAQYAGTRHNIGADFVSRLADEAGIELRLEKKFKGLYGKGIVDGRSCHLLIPTTFMNLSGEAVQVLQQFYKLTPKQILVAHDELDLPVGVPRLKYQGGHGGHNGLRDIIARSGKDFYRLRLGIDHPGNAKAVSNYVLSKPRATEITALQYMLDDATAIMPLLMAGDWQQAMQTLHTK